MRVLLGLKLVFLVTAVPAEDSFTYGFSGRGSLGASVGSGVRENYTLTLEHAGEGFGAQGFAFGIVADQAEIVSVTIAGTDAARALDEGWVQCEITTGEGNQGAVCGVVVSTREFRTVGANRRASVGIIEVEAVIPENGGTATLRYADDLQGTGQPVDNHVVLMTRDRDSVTMFPSLEEFPVRLEVGAELKRGDCNGDLTVDISDVIYWLNNLFSGGPDSPCREACDVNGDSTGDISDAIFLLNFLFGGGGPPEAPGTHQCGRDPVPEESLGCEDPACG